MGLFVALCIVCGITYVAYRFGISEGQRIAEILANNKFTEYCEMIKSKETERLRSELTEEARAYADKLYSEKIADFKKVLNEICDAHPDNHYISTILTDATEVLLEEGLTEYWGRAPATAHYIKKKFNEHARQWQLDAQRYKYQVLLYESMFPKLEDYALADSLPQEQTVRPSDWLSGEEYNKLTDIQKLERAQVSLERYIKGPKSKWEVGRDYELYIGHLFRKNGWQVVQNGINAKLEDLGRDLICRKNGVTLIVQCKFWSQNKEIHEKHIAQLLGTTLSYAVENNLPNVELGHIGSNVTKVVPVFVTSTKLSETAMRFAKALHVDARSISFDPCSNEFPRIKCNIGNEGKIFHLPFDQLYDRVEISKPGECYATTVKEAMSHGFRRAHRWSGDLHATNNGNVF